MSNLVSKTILVTGASSGIGRSIAEKLLQQHIVIGASRNINKFTTTHAHFSAVELDLGRLDSIAVTAKKVQSAYPNLNTVIFAAGYGQFGGLEQFSYAQINELISVNLIAQMYLTKALLPKLKQQPHSHLIYIGSEAALKGSRNGTVYCASKFALRGFTQALRDECAKSSVRVSLINPGMVTTPFFDNLDFAPGKNYGQALRAEDIADTVNYILQANPACQIDEINLSPLHKVIDFKK